MMLSSATVLVLGAGFTRAFVPDAPLLVDDYQGERLLAKFQGFSHAHKVLQNELVRHQGNIDLERLMTRLYGQMPYDREHGASEELALLLADLKRAFADRISKAKSNAAHSQELAELAKLCIKNQTTCITFNYDDVFDEALFKVRPSIGSPTDPYWHPDGGYGFFCRPSTVSVCDSSVFMDKTSMLLLKLHGSANWRIRRGYTQPHSVDSIVHHEDWPGLTEYAALDVDRHTIELHLDQEPFMVPPLLTKESLINQPILRLVWSQAFDALRRADEIVFIGYSLPITDIAATYLFHEAISGGSTVKVVNLASTENERSHLVDTYRKVFPKIPLDHFDFDGALEWIQKIAPQRTPSDGEA